MTEIKIHVQHKHSSIIGDVSQIVTDNTDYAMKFTFDSDWEDGPKNVLFVLDDGYAFAPVITEDNIAKVPKIVDDKTRTLYVGVQQGDVKTTLPCTIRVFPSIAQMVKDDAVQPDPSMWEFVLHKLDELEKNGASEAQISAAVEKYLDENPVDSGVNFTPGNALELTDDGTLNVKTTNEAETDNTLPITSSGVYTIVGNIGAILDTI